MQPFTRSSGLVLPINQPNVDTDALIPKQFLKSIQRTGFGQNLFDEWRYLDQGEPGEDCTHRPQNAECVINQPQYEGATIILGRENFGCGSSREHAVWALHDFGIKVLICTGFADIFRSNCIKNGLLPITLESQLIDMLFQAVSKKPGFSLEVDLEAQVIFTPQGEAHAFQIDEFSKHCLLNGLDEIELTLGKAMQIQKYEASRRVQEPWIFD